MESFNNKKEWFSRLFGFEENPKTIQSQFSISTDNKGDFYITSKENNKTYCVGNFQIRDFQSFNHIQDSEHDGKFNIIIGDGTEKVGSDIITSETNPENNGSTFQMASNFNCLDHIPGHKPPRGLLSNYPTHGEQGGPGTVACGPALVYRQYLLPMPNGRTGQMEDDIELLSRTPITVEDGYIREIPEFFDYSNPNLYQIGVHQNIDVTLGRAGVDCKKYRIIKDQRIHQVFCSTVSFGSVSDNDFNLNVASSILKNEYKLTILSAMENSIKYPDRKGSKKVFLCLLGTGCFFNPLSLVSEAISDCTEFIKKSGLDVNLVCFNQKIADQVIPFLKNTIEQTGGSVINL